MIENSKCKNCGHEASYHLNGLGECNFDYQIIPNDDCKSFSPAQPPKDEMSKEETDYYEKLRPAQPPKDEPYYLDIEVQEQIIGLRVRHGLTQEKLAKLAGTKQESIARAESNGIATLTFLKRIAHAVGEEVYVEIKPKKHGDEKVKSFCTSLTCDHTNCLQPPNKHHGPMRAFCTNPDCDGVDCDYANDYRPMNQPPKEKHRFFGKHIAEAIDAFKKDTPPKDDPRCEGDMHGSRCSCFDKPQPADPKLSIVEEFRKKVSELSGAIIYKEMGDESQVVDFGYRVLRGTETWKVVDFGNIEKFLLAALEAHGKAEREKSEEMVETAWGIICNVSGGDWSKQSKMWQEATKKFRDKYFNRTNE